MSAIEPADVTGVLPDVVEQRPERLEAGGLDDRDVGEESVGVGVLPCIAAGLAVRLLDDGADALPDEERAAVTARQFVGDPDQVAVDLQARVLDPGVDGLIVNLVTNGHEPGAVDVAGRTLRKLLG